MLLKVKLPFTKLPDSELSGSKLPLPESSCNVIVPVSSVSVLPFKSTAFAIIFTAESFHRWFSLSDACNFVATTLTVRLFCSDITFPYPVFEPSEL